MTVTTVHHTVCLYSSLAKTYWLGIDFTFISARSFKSKFVTIGATLLFDRRASDTCYVWKITLQDLNLLTQSWNCTLTNIAMHHINQMMVWRKNLPKKISWAAVRLSGCIRGWAEDASLDVRHLGWISATATEANGCDNRSAPVSALCLQQNGSELWKTWQNVGQPPPSLPMQPGTQLFGVSWCTLVPLELEKAK